MSHCATLRRAAASASVAPVDDTTVATAGAGAPGDVEAAGAGGAGGGTPPSKSAWGFPRMPRIDSQPSMDGQELMEQEL